MSSLVHRYATHSTRLFQHAIANPFSLIRTGRLLPPHLPLFLLGGPSRHTATHLDRPNGLLPIRRFGNGVLQVASDKRLIPLRTARFLILDGHDGVLHVVWANQLSNTEKPARHAVEKDVEVIGFVDLAFCAARFAVGHECGGGGEVLEAHGAFHAGDAVFGEDVLVDVGGAVEGLSRKIVSFHDGRGGKGRTYSQTKGQWYLHTTAS